MLSKTSRYVLTLLLLSLGVLASAGDIDVKIVDYPREAIKGIPVEVSAVATNVSGKSLALACGGASFKLGFNIRRADGKPRNMCPYESTAGNHLNLEPIVLARDWKQTIGGEVNCGDEASGEMILEAFVSVKSCANPPTVGHGDKTWEGEVKSKPVRLVIAEPQGVDKEAYEAYKHSPISRDHWQDILRRFPTSVYAGYHFKYLHWNLRAQGSSADEVVAQLSSPDFLKRFPEIEDPYSDATANVPMVSARQAVKDRIKLFSDYLRLHPDFPGRAEYLEWWLAEAYLMDGRYQEAFESFSWLAKNDPDKRRSAVASEYMSAMKRKGLVAP